MTKPVVGKPYTASAKALELGSRGFESPVKESRLVSFRLVYDDNTHRVFRGGSCCDDANDARAGVPILYSPGGHGTDLGFRLVREDT